jgi:hypothetical protein
MSAWSTFDIIAVSWTALAWATVSFAPRYAPHFLGATLAVGVALGAFPALKFALLVAREIGQAFA